MDDLLNEFLIETTESISVLDGELVRLEQNPNDPELLGNIFRLVHTIKGTCGFLGLPRLEAVAHAAENVLGKFRDGDMEVTPDAVSVILQALDRIKEIVTGLEQTEKEPQGDDGALIAALNELAETGAVAAEKAVEPSQEAAPSEPFWERLGGLSSVDALIDVFYAKVMADEALSPLYAGVVLEVMKGDQRDYISEIAGGPERCHADDPRNGHPFIGAVGLDESHCETTGGYFREALAELEIDDATADELMALLEAKRQELADPTPAPDTATVETPETGAAAPPAAAKEPAAAKGSEHSAVTHTIRVNVDLLENLMTMVSELVLTRNQLMQILRIRDDDTEFGAPLQRLSHVTSELQEGVMKTRMQPIGNAWAKLPRIVRDLAHELGKKIDLQMLGAETELDRQVLELIRDPLTHMVRNSGDHGLERPEERRAAGKSESGTITLNAYHEGGHIIIEISDDGRGLNIDRIKAKALNKGLTTEAELEGMSDQQIQQFVFKPGFSTAEQVTAVSGRGVGMDVVRTNIERIGGNVELQSVEHKGTKFTIKIPLTLAIVSALVVEAGGERFAIPQISVLELVRSSTHSEHTIEFVNGTPVLRLRNRLLPLVSLRRLLKLDEAAAAAPGESSLYERAGGARAIKAVVDRFYAKVLADDSLKPFFDNVDLGSLKGNQRDFIAMALGGPDNYTGADLRSAHQHLVAQGLNDRHFDRVAQLLSDTLGELGVDAGLQGEIMAVVATTRDEILGRDRQAAPAAVSGEQFIVVTQVGTYTFGIIVDRVFDTEEIVVKPVAPILRHISMFSGNTILGDGSVIMILDPNGIAAATGEVVMQETKPTKGLVGHDERRQEKVALLLFKAGDGTMKAVPLALIARLEEFAADKIEIADGRPVVQYRGGLMPLIQAQPLQQVREEGRQPVLVFSDNDRSMGLVVDEIVDIVEDALDIEVGSDQPGVVGSAIVAGRATEIIDAGYFVTQAYSDWFEKRSDSDAGQDQRRLLLVDDSPFFRNLLTPLLAVAGYDVTSVESGDRALRLCEAGADFDVIISDIEMPGMNGFEFAEAVRSNERWHDKPLVALSAVATPEAMDRGREVGFTDYVAKSDRDALLHTLSQTIAARRGAA
jgi:chemotaxis protein histidine kinase CheA/CheY-like chemotaxis protein